MVDLTREEIERAARFSQAIDMSGMSLDAIGEQCGVSAQAVMKWKKTGKIKTGSLIKFADAVNKDIVYLYTGVTKPKSTGRLSQIEDIINEMTENQYQKFILLGSIVVDESGDIRNTLSFPSKSS